MTVEQLKAKLAAKTRRTVEIELAGETVQFQVKALSPADLLPYMKELPSVFAAINEGTEANINDTSSMVGFVTLMQQMVVAGTVWPPLTLDPNDGERIYVGDLDAGASGTEVWANSRKLLGEIAELSGLGTFLRPVEGPAN